MGNPPFESAIDSFSVENRHCKNRRTSGDSLWSKRKAIKRLEDEDSCYEAET
jgi:hypothetical protein